MGHLPGWLLCGKSPLRHLPPAPPGSLSGRHLLSSTKAKMSHHEIKFLAQESHVEPDSPTYLARFDTDSFRIGVDTLCTRTLSGNKEHFEDLHLYKGKEVTGISGGLEIAGEGTFVFNIQSDDGIIDTIRIPRSLYVPASNCPCCLPNIGLKLPETIHL